jgi:hypothetical protein
MDITSATALHHARVCRFDSWRDGEPTDFARLSYGDLKPLTKYQTPEASDFLMPNFLSGSDYCSSGSVEVSNHRVFLERYKDSPNTYDVYGDYGTFAVAIRLDSVTDDMMEDLKALEDYPILDEDDHSKVEMDAENEAWASWGRHDFTRELEKIFPASEDTIDAMAEEKIDELFYSLMERTNTYWQHESGNSAYVDLDRVIAGCTLADLGGGQ